MEKIGVTYLQLNVAGFIDVEYHLAIFYQDSAGVKQVIEVGPQFSVNQGMAWYQGVAEIAKELWQIPHHNDGSPFGLIVGSPTGFRPWDSGDDSRPPETLLTGTDLSAVWAGMVADAAQLIADGYEYRPVTQNSNTFAGTILRDANLRLPTGAPIGLSYVPGLQYILQEPTRGQTDYPISLGASDYAFADPDKNTTSLVVGDPTYVTIRWGNGTATASINGDTSNVVADTVTSVTGVDGHVMLTGSSGDDTFDGRGSDCLMLGGPGDDTFLLGYGGNDWIDGGSGNDTATYSKSADSYTVTLSAANGMDTGPANDQIVEVVDNATGGTDRLTSVEDIKLADPSGSGGTSNTVIVKALADGHAPPSDITTIDLGAMRLDSNNTVELSQYDKNVYLSSSHSQTTPGVALYGDRNFTQKLGYAFTNFTTLILGKGDNKVQLYSADNPYLTTVQTGNGDNTITSDVLNLKIDLGTGHNIIGHLGRGTIVNTQGSGGNKFITSDDILLNGLTPTDDIFADGTLLRGAVGFLGSEDPWIVGPDGTRYGLNFQGDLVIEDKSGGKTYVSNYHGGPDVPYAQQIAGIFVGLAEVHAERLLDLKRPYIENVHVMFKLGNELLYVRTGKTFFNNDPLVFDLGGTGVSLTPLSSVAPMLDLRGNGFATHSGWVGANDGVLVLQQAGHSGTPTISEMFGGPGAEGLAALAQYDVNADGVIDANDAVYTQLRMWVDVNGNGTVDTGELETLQQAGVASISLASTTQTADTQAGNTITATGSFTRVDGTTGAIDDVNFNVDTFHSRYLGDTTVSTAAAAMPNLKGYGTLTDLRVAMTLDPTLIGTINANLPNLNVPNLAALRAAALPIFLAWARAVKLPDASGTLQVVDPAAGHSDVPILLSTDANGNVTVDDFGYVVTDDFGSYWKLASGASVRDAGGDAIARPTFAQVMAQVPASGSSDTWQNFSASEIGFMERLYGQAFPIDQAPTNPTAMLAAMSNFVTGSITALDLDALRLAMQGPLAAYFPGIAYDTASDTFTATTAGELTPMYLSLIHI